MAVLFILLQIEPFAEVTASIEAYVSAYIIRAGVYGDGTLVRVSLPVTLSYEASRVSGKQWCVALNARLTALELSAGIFYQWWSWWWWDWGDRNTLYEFGKWSAINSDWQVIYRCGQLNYTYTALFSATWKACSTNCVCELDRKVQAWKQYAVDLIGKSSLRVE